MNECKGVVSYGVCIPSFNCRYVLRIPREFQCAFTNETGDCGDEDNDVHYTHYLFCRFNDYNHSMYFGMFILMFNVMNYFWTLCNISDFLTPSLCFVANYIGVSENFACATFLAFGNSASDILTALIGGQKKNQELVVIYVIGKGLFVTTIVAAMVFMTERFQMYQRAFFRHAFAYLVASVFVLSISVEPTIYLWEMIGCFILYALYVIMFLASDWLVMKVDESLISTVQTIVKGENNSEVQVIQRAGTGNIMSVHVPTLRQGRQIGEMRNDPDSQAHPSVMSARSSWLRLQEYAFNKPWLDRTSLMIRANTTSLHRILRPDLSSHHRQRLAHNEMHFPTARVPRKRKVPRKGAVNSALDMERTKLLRLAGQHDAKPGKHTRMNAFAVDIGGERVIERKVGLIGDFLEHMSPVDDFEWSEASNCSKVVMLAEAPMLYFCKLTIPCIDEAVLLNNWCKLLNCIHCVSVPLVYLWVTGIFDYPPQTSIPITVSAISAGIMLAIFVFLTSHVNMAPRYHLLFGLAGIISAVLLMYVILKDVISILNAIGNVFGIRKGTLFSTFLPWGNTIPQIIYTITLSKAGFPKLAFSSTIGCAIFVLLIGLGVSSFYLMTFYGESLQYAYIPNYRGLLANEMFYSLSSILATLIVLPLFDFHCRASFAWFLISLYVMFLIITLLSEFRLIYPLSHDKIFI